MSTTVTGNMIPNFTAFFGGSSNLAQWLTSGATLISGITIPIMAFLIKRIPNKVYFFSAMTAFTLGSLAAFLAVSFPMLNLRVFKYPTFRIAVISSLCLYLISMGSAMILPIFTKTMCGFSDTAYGLATLIGSDMVAIHGIYIYFGLITIAIVVAVILYLKAEGKKLH